MTPSYRFLWQVWGVIDTLHSHGQTMVALLDYKTGRVLYDVRDDLTGGGARGARREHVAVAVGAVGRGPMHVPTSFATAFYDLSWVKALLYFAITLVVARVVDELLARRDRALAAVLKRNPDASERTRFRMIRASCGSPSCSSAAPSPCRNYRWWARWRTPCWPPQPSSPAWWASPRARPSPTWPAAS